MKLDYRRYNPETSLGVELVAQRPNPTVPLFETHPNHDAAQPCQFSQCMYVHTSVGCEVTARRQVPQQLIYLTDVGMRRCRPGRSQSGQCIVVLPIP